MKAEFDYNGNLIVTAENNLERYALKTWWNDKSHGFGVEYGESPQPEDTTATDSRADT